MLQIIAKDGQMKVSLTEPAESPLMTELRSSLEAGNVTWALIQADYALKGRPMPEKITDVHPHERRGYEDRALAVLMSCNRDAELFAKGQASHRAFEMFETFVKDMGLDWLDDSHPANEGDALEVLITRMSEAALQRRDHVLSGIFPGLSRYLERVRSLWEAGRDE